MHDENDSRRIDRLVHEARNGSHDAFRRLVEAHRTRLEALIHLRLGARLRRRLEVEDVVQETLLRVHEALPAFRPCGRSFFQWMGAISENVIRNLARYHFGTQKRNMAREVRLPRETDSSDGDPAAWLEGREISPSVRLRRKERIGRLEGALNKLTSDQREVVLLLLVEGLPRSEVARRMNRSVDAVSMLLLRSLRRLRSVLGSTESFHLPSHTLASLGGVSESPRPNADGERPANESSPGNDGARERRANRGDNGLNGSRISRTPTSDKT